MVEGNLNCEGKAEEEEEEGWLKAAGCRRKKGEGRRRRLGKGKKRK